MRLANVTYEEKSAAEKRFKYLGISRPQVSSFVLYGGAISGFVAAVFEGLAGPGKMEENILFFLVLILVGAGIGAYVGREKVNKYEKSLETVIAEIRFERSSTSPS
ncbi:hypothetical protein J7382_11010 [Shimia sp. R11_0]|uniref:hypothetical protein n=1 Tax=Shimia sp. R11_0 TaxID=2821096 RepID=UPI001ADC68F0|nr:hypothetical protein [Shimia sp. R11_0]MBO9478067.1 hypothetical protein [Shimia sp. R11_0]